MNILILSPFFPYPLSQGGKIRVFNIIKFLSKRGHHVTLACLSEEKINDYGPLKDYCEGIFVTYKQPSTAKNLFRFLTGPDPFNYVRYSSSEMKTNLLNLLQVESFDLVQIEFSLMWQYADIFKGLPVVLDAHNIEYEIIEQIRGLQQGTIKKMAYDREQKRLKNRERQAWRECELCFAVSDKEREVVISYLGNSDKVFTVPNGVDLERYHFSPKTRMDNQLLFIGGMEYLPNLDSAQYLLNEIFPLVQSRMPAVNLDVVGRELWRIKNKKSRKGIQFHDNVPDVLPFFRKADLLLVPLRYGAGTRIKILEAMASGVPVVSTSKGCEGIEAVHGEHLLIADTPGSFVSEIDRIINDDVLRKSIVLNARSLVENKYAWEKIVGDMEMCYGKITH